MSYREIRREAARRGSASQEPSRRDDLLMMLLHGGAATNSIARYVVDALADEVRAEQAVEIEGLRKQVAQVVAEVERFGIYGPATTATKALVERASDLVDENASLKSRLNAVLDICDREQRGAMRWQDPLPVPEWVAVVQRAALGDAPTPAPVPVKTAGDETGEADGCTCMPHMKFACGHCQMDVCFDCHHCPCGCDCAEGGE